MSPTRADDLIFFERRLAEEQAKASSSSCLVRAVHTAFVEQYRLYIDGLALDVTPDRRCAG